MTTPFIEFPKIARYSRAVTVTEKIDGSNGTVYIGSPATQDEGVLMIGSRQQWITPEADNHGFAKWCMVHKDELMTLGPGYHRGEWWGSGIQRGYGLQKGEKRWSLFNTHRWCLYGHTPKTFPQADPRIVKMQDILPACVGLVPVLWEGNMDSLCLPSIMAQLQAIGSCAAPGFMRPEGIVLFHHAANKGFKKTFEKDDEPKGLHATT